MLKNCQHLELWVIEKVCGHCALLGMITNGGYIQSVFKIVLQNIPYFWKLKVFFVNLVVELRTAVYYS